MDSDENQQALAWQQIIRNRAFYNVRVRRGESWVDAACRTLDELIDQKEQAEKSLSECLASQLTSRDDLPTCGEIIDALNRNRDAIVENREQSISSLQRLLADTEADSDRWRRAHEIVEGERDLARDRCRELERERDEAWRVAGEQTRLERDRAEAAEARTAPAVTKADVEQAIRPKFEQWQSQLAAPVDRAIDEAWALVSGADPAVHVVRESDVAAVVVSLNSRGEWFADDVHIYTHSAEDARNLAKGHIQSAIRRFAAARAIEAGQNVDPVEDKARELYEVANRATVWNEVVKSAELGNRADIQVTHEYRAIARHVLRESK